MGDFLLNQQNVSKFSAPAAPKMRQFGPFFDFLVPSALKIVSFLAKGGPLLASDPSNSSSNLDSIYHYTIAPMVWYIPC